MGLSDQDIVALSGAHTLGRARPDRSGFGKESTKYTKEGPGAPGGSSWTVQWLKFDNRRVPCLVCQQCGLVCREGWSRRGSLRPWSTDLLPPLLPTSRCRCCSYFQDIKQQQDEELLVLPTDACLFEDEGFRPFAEKYLADEAAFFADYVASHLKLSELGVEWDGEPVTLKP